MAVLSDCSSLIEVGLALNLAAPALARAFGGLEHVIVQATVDAYLRKRPDKRLDEFAESVLREVIEQSYTNFPKLRMVANAQIMMSLLVAFASAYALAHLSVSPEEIVPDRLVWSYWWIAVLILPTSYVIARSIARRIGDSSAKEIGDGKTDLDLLFDSYELIEPHRRALDDLDQRLKAIRAAALARGARRASKPK